MRRASTILLAGLATFGQACSKAPAPASRTAPASEGAAVPMAPLGTASISGRVTFDGAVPAPARINLSSEPKCAAQRPEGLVRRSVSVQQGGLADVVVYVKSGLSGSVPAVKQPVVLDQQGCEYVPHVVALQVGQPLVVRNSDDLAHNVHMRPAANRESNKGQPRKGIEQTVTFDKPELLFPVGCDIHPWMRAFVAVLSNPYHAVTSADGSFAIEGLAAGTYEVEAAHARLKTVTTAVTLKDGEAGQATLAFR